MNNQTTTAKDFFINLGVLVTLYASVAAVLNLLFSIINSAFPDSLNYYGIYSDSYSIRFAISTLVILFPLYIYLARYIRKDIEINPFKSDIWIKKWTKYLTLFLTGGAIVTDLIVLINAFLGGEISIRFILKVAAVLLVAGFVFFYYVYEKHKNNNLLIAIASAIVLGSVVGGFLTIGSPKKQRDIQFDQTRISNLQSIKYEIESYAFKNKSIPTSLKDLDASNSYLTIKDPETKEMYEYNILGDGKYSYELCAKFKTVSDAEFWPHQIGRVCFAQPLSIK